MTSLAPERLVSPLRRLSTPLAVIPLVMVILGLTSVETPEAGRFKLDSGLDGLVLSLSSMEVLAELARLATIALAVYLLISLVALNLTRLVARSIDPRHARGLRIFERVQTVLRTLAPRFVVTLAAGSILSTGVASASQPGSAAGSTVVDGKGVPDAPTMELVAPEQSARTRMPWGKTTDAPDSGPLADISVAEDSVADESTADNRAADASTAAIRPADEGITGQPQVVAVAPTHTVLPGEHLWSIAEDTVAARSGGTAAPDEIIAYWRHLIDQNRDLLVDRDNPDLILPGQVLRLPPGHVGAAAPRS